MKKSLFLLFFVASFVQAQYSVKGNLNSVGKYSDVYLYKVEGAQQRYVKNAKINTQNNNGTFQINLPSNATSGMYRVIYDLTQANSYVEFIFNKENVEFSFDAKKKNETLIFNRSKENKLYNNFLIDISTAQNKIDSFQTSYFKTPSQTTATSYKKAVVDINRIQKSYEERAAGTMAYHFIKATKRYNPLTAAKTAESYLKASASHFFDYIDFNNTYLINSSFLVDRITDYIFYLNYSEDAKAQEGLYKKAINTSLGKLTNIPLKAGVIQYLISNFSAYKKTSIVEFLFTNHFDKLPKKNQNLEFKQQTLAAMNIAIGKVAPDFSWTENGKKMSLAQLKDGQSYLLIFYSTGCSHCLREVPQVFDFMKGKNKTKVIAFAMETEDTTWKKYKKALPGWHHVLGLNKWENKIARMYQITSTPTYFVLGYDKKIIANPEQLKELKVILEGLN